MKDWLASPYRSVGIYIGGVNRACAQSNLTAAWIQAIQAEKLQGKIAVYDQTGGNAEDFTMVKNGQLTGTLPSYPASIGSAAVQALVDAGQGTTPERFIDNDGNPSAVSGAITKSTIGSSAAQYQ